MTKPSVLQTAEARWRRPEIADLPDDIRDRITAVQEKSGFVPNVFLVPDRISGDETCPTPSLR